MVQVSNQRGGEREGEIQLFRIHVTCPLATDSFIISSFNSGGGDLSNIDTEWKCDEVWFCGVFSSLKSKRSDMSQSKANCSRDFSDQVLMVRP